MFMYTHAYTHTLSEKINIYFEFAYSSKIPTYTSITSVDFELATVFDRPCLIQDQPNIVMVPGKFRPSTLVLLSRSTASFLLAGVLVKLLNTKTDIWEPVSEVVMVQKPSRFSAENTL